MGDLSGKVAFITGATGGLGPAVVQRLAQAGATCVAAYHAEGEMDRLETRLNAAGLHAERQPLDVLDAEAVKRTVQTVLAAHGTIDIFAHLVGGYLGGRRVDQLAADQWKHMIDLNLTSAYVCCHEILPTMRERGY